MFNGININKYTDNLIDYDKYKYNKNIFTGDNTYFIKEFKIENEDSNINDNNDINDNGNDDKNTLNKKNDLFINEDNKFNGINNSEANNMHNDENDINNINNEK